MHKFHVSTQPNSMQGSSEGIVTRLMFGGTESWFDPWQEQAISSLKHPEWLLGSPSFLFGGYMWLVS